MLSTFAINAVMSVLVMLMTAYWPWRAYQQQTTNDARRVADYNRHKREAAAWASLTDADREWFHANYWDGEKVLDERRTE